MHIHSGKEIQITRLEEEFPNIIKQIHHQKVDAHLQASRGLLSKVDHGILCQVRQELMGLFGLVKMFSNLTSLLVRV